MRSGLFLLVLMSSFAASAQRDEDYEYTKEFIWGLSKNSNGGTIGSIVFRWSQSIGNDIYRTIGFELSNVHHPKEYRYPSVNGSTYIFGKSNYLYAIRLQYGREKIFFRKDTQQGVQINAGLSGGPTIGFHAPYYIQQSDGAYVKYDPDIHLRPFGILGPGRLFQGLGQSKIMIGLNVKGSVSFEFGTYKGNVVGIEMGTMVEAFTKEVILVPTQANRAIFPSVFLTLYWGKRK